LPRGDQALCADDLDRGAVVTFKELEQLPGHRPLQASPDLAAALALGRAPGGVRAGGWIITEPSHHDGVQRPVELAVT
jgi:hypothetical protein